MHKNQSKQIAVRIDLTPEIKARLIKVSEKVYDIVRHETKGPVEAVAVLQNVMDAIGGKGAGALFDSTNIIGES